MPIRPDDTRLSFHPMGVAIERPPGTSSTEDFHQEWWVHTPGKGLLVWENAAVQAQSDEQLCRRLAKRVYPWAEVIQVEVVRAYLDPSGKVLGLTTEPTAVPRHTRPDDPNAQAITVTVPRDTWTRLPGTDIEVRHTGAYALGLAVRAVTP